MGKGPLFGFDGGARACRTTHKEAGAWPQKENKETPHGTSAARTTNQSVTASIAPTLRGPCALVIDFARDFHRRLRKAGEASHDRITMAETKATPGIPSSVWHLETMAAHGLGFIRFGFSGSPYQQPDETTWGRRYALSPAQIRELIDELQSALRQVEECSRGTAPAPKANPP